MYGKPRTVAFHRRNLPHWYVENRVYFVTFCLKGALPTAVLENMRQELLDFLSTAPSPSDTDEFAGRRFRKIEGILDSAEGSPRHLEKPEVARLVVNGLDWLESRHGWEVPAWVVMPNHVHCLLHRPSGSTGELGGHLGILKGYVAREANRILGRSGNFWLSEIFDRWCRSPDKYDAAVRYIRNNPVKAGLAEVPDQWPWLKLPSEQPHE
jgi:REP element-mobilizing transposase RayT